MTVLLSCVASAAAMTLPDEGEKKKKKFCSLCFSIFCSVLCSSAFVSVSVFIFVHCFVVCLFGFFWRLWIDNAVL